MKGNVFFNFNSAQNYEQQIGFWSEKISKIFVDWLEIPKKTHILDLACGTGALTRNFKDFASLSGLDANLQALQIAQKYINADFFYGDLLALPFQNNQFDVITFALVLEMLANPELALQEALRVAKSNAIVAAYLWEIPNGYPYADLLKIMRNFNFLPQIYDFEFSSQNFLQNLWQEALLKDISLHKVSVQKNFYNWENYWDFYLNINNFKMLCKNLDTQELSAFQEEIYNLAQKNNFQISASCIAIKGFKN